MWPKLHVLGFIFFFSLATNAFAGARPGQILSEDICEEISSSSESTQRFVSEVVDAIHKSNGCESNAGCYKPASKRVAPYSAFIVLPPEMSHNVGINSEIKELIEVIAPLAGVDVQLEAPSSLDFLAFVYIDELNFTEIRESYINNIIAPDNLGFVESREAVFDSWLVSDQICAQLNTEYEDGGIQDAQVWIRLFQDYEKTKACVDRAALMALGLRNPQLDSGDGNNSDSNVIHSNRIFLELLYSKYISAGQSKETTAAAISNLVRQDCDIEF